jgi:hypothetical protein
MLTVTVNSVVREAGIEAACAAHNASLPEDATPLTPEQYLQQVVDDATRSYVAQFRVGTVYSSEYVLRFTAAEWAAINAAATSDENIAGYLLRVRELPEVRLWSDEMMLGHAYLVSKGLLTPQRSEEIRAF